MKTSTSSVLTKRTDAVRLHRFQQKAEPPPTPPPPPAVELQLDLLWEKFIETGDQLFLLNNFRHIANGLTGICVHVGYSGAESAEPSGTGGGVAVRSPRTDIEILKLRVNQEATNVCRSVRLPSVRFEHCILWLVLSIRCSVIVLIGLLLREFLCLFRPMQVRLVR